MNKHVGRLFGRLVILDVETTKTRGGNYTQKASVRCVCGVVYTTHLQNLTSGKVSQCKSCGLAARAKAASSGYKHPLFAVWSNMIGRCHNPASEGYRLYGARGIEVCARWRGTRANGERCTVDGFHLFVSDMGERPAGLSIERIDNNGPYAPGNCRWATQEQQANNMRTNVQATVGTITKTVAQWAKELGVPATKLYSAHRAAGMEYQQIIERLLVLPTKARGKYVHWTTRTRRAGGYKTHSAHVGAWVEYLIDQAVGDFSRAIDDVLM